MNEQQIFPGKAQLAEPIARVFENLTPSGHWIMYVLVLATPGWVCNHQLLTHHESDSPSLQHDHILHSH